MILQALQTLLEKRMRFINDTIVDKEDTDEVDVKNGKNFAAREVVVVWGNLAGKTEVWDEELQKAVEEWDEEPERVGV